LWRAVGVRRRRRRRVVMVGLEIGIILGVRVMVGKGILWTH
jgi:hypothetical protein